MKQTSFKLVSLKSKFGGIFILKLLFVLLNVRNCFELLDTLRFEIILPFILWNFSFMVDGTPGSKGNFSNIEFINLMFIEFNSLQFNLKYVGFSNSTKSYLFVLGNETVRRFDWSLYYNDTDQLHYSEYDICS